MRNRPVPEVSEADQAFMRALLLYEDPALMVFKKPSGLAVQTRGNRGRSFDHLLWSFARSNGKRPRLVHRLDTGTSGVLLVGRTKPATAFLSQAFARRDVKKTYLAAVRGREQSKEQGEISVSLVSQGRRTHVVTGDQENNSALTRWWRLGQSGPEMGSGNRDGASLLRVQPLTGRMHQIRAHLAYVGWPIIGDTLYGNVPSTDALAPTRLMLHALRLDVPHPDGGRRIFEAPPPEDFYTGLLAAGLQPPAPGSV